AGGLWRWRRAAAAARATGLVPGARSVGVALGRRPRRGRSEGRTAGLTSLPDGGTAVARAVHRPAGRSGRLGARRRRPRAAAAARVASADEPWAVPARRRALAAARARGRRARDQGLRRQLHVAEDA